MDYSFNEKKEFACDKCHKSFTRYSTLYIHVKSIHRGQIFSCDKCHKTFNQKSNLKAHMNMIHLKLRPFKCDFCPHASKRKQALSFHIQKKHCGPLLENNRRKRQHASNSQTFLKCLKCDFCPKTYQDEMEKAEHIVEDHADQVFNNDESEASEKTGTGNMAEVPAVEENHVKCATTQQSHESKDPKLTLYPVVLLTKIKFNFTPPNVAKKSFKCPFQNCNKNYKAVNNLNAHVWAVHRRRQFKCDKCSKVFTSKQRVRLHVEAVHQGKRHTCPVCRHVYKRADYLKTHVERHHGQEQITKFKEK